MLAYTLRLVRHWFRSVASRRLEPAPQGKAPRFSPQRLPLRVEELEPRTAPSGSPPTLAITGPGDYSLHKVGDIQTITFTAGDPDSPGATIDFYYDTDKTATNGHALIAGGVSKDAPSINWDTSAVPPGLYYIYGVISDGENTAGAWSGGPVVLNTTAGTPVATFNTSLGSFSVMLDQNAAPITVANFRTYAAAGAYNGTIFHRVMSSFMIQGGGYLPTMTHIASNPQIANENLRDTTNNLHNVTGTIAMARTSAPNSATSEFFVNVVDNVSWNPTATNLDYQSASAPGYTAFGHVISGMGVVNDLKSVPVHNNGSGEFSAPDNPPVITSVTVADVQFPNPDILWNTLSAAPTSVRAGENLAITRDYQVLLQNVNPDFNVQYRLSVNRTWGDADDIILTASETISAPAGKNLGSHSGTFTATVPPNTPINTYYILGSLDNGSAVAEVDEYENVMAGTRVSVLGAFGVTFGDGTVVNSIRYTDPDGSTVKLMVQGATLTAHFLGDNVGVKFENGVVISDADGRVELADIALTGNSDATKVTFTVTGGTDGAATVQRISADIGNVGALAAANTDVIGNGVVMGAGYIANVQLRDLLNGADILMPGATTKGVTIKARTLSSGTDVNVASPLKSFTVAQWTDGSLTAPWATGISVSGDVRGGLVGNLGADIILSGVGVTGGKPVLGSLSVTGAMTGDLTVSGGGSGNISANSITGSHINVAGDIASLKTLKGGLSADVTAGRGIGSISVTASTAGGSLLGSFIANGSAGIGMVSVTKGGFNATLSAPAGPIKSLNVGGGDISGRITSGGSAGIGTISAPKGGLNGVTISAAHIAGAIKAINIGGGVTAGALIAGTGGIAPITIKGDANLNITTTGKVGAFTQTGSAIQPRALSGTFDVKSLSSLTTTNTNITGLVIRATETIGTVNAKSLTNTTFCAGGIGNITVGGNVAGASIFAGYDNGFGLVFGTAGKANIGAIKIQGGMTGSNISAGIAPGPDLVFGNDGDLVVSDSLQGAITSLTVNGPVSGSTVVAHGKLGAGSVTINGQKQTLDWSDPITHIVIKQNWKQ